MGERWWIVRLQQVAVVTLLACTFLAGAVHTQQYGQSAQYTECDSNRGYCVNSGQCSVRTFRLRTNRCPTFEEVCCPRSSFPPERLLSMTPYSNRTPKALAPTVIAQPSVSPNDAADDDLIPATDIPDESVEIAKLSVTVAPTPATSSPINEKEQISSSKTALSQNISVSTANFNAKSEDTTNAPPVVDDVVESPKAVVTDGNTSASNIGIVGSNDEIESNNTSNSLNSTLKNNEYENTSAIHSDPKPSPGSVSPNAHSLEVVHENSTYSKCGQQAEYGEFPWTVALFRKAEKLTFCCNGALIDERTVLTTAQCVILCGNSSSEIVARVGEWNISTPMPIPSQEIGVTNIRIHQATEPVSDAYNIAFLVLELSVQNRTAVQPVYLGNTFTQSKMMIASGWSIVPTEQQSTTYQVQQRFDLIQVLRETCQSKLQSLDNQTNDTLPSSVLCASSNCTDQERISDREEGSPVVVKESGQYHLRGLVSRSFNLKEETVSYTILVNLKNFRTQFAEIHKLFNEEEISTTKRTTDGKIDKNRVWSA
uniref:Peptidase S1 domain-containing protein n=1 Tax=Anopheles dirus TaxID=7168 RepID=A0A1Y9H285_9DIPT